VTRSTCRDEVVAAFEALGRATGRTEFRTAEILAQVRLAGSTYADATIRTQLASVMFVDRTLDRLGRGVYRLAHRPPRVLTAVS
jgi:hypothetical protein